MSMDGGKEIGCLQSLSFGRQRTNNAALLKMDHVGKLGATRRGQGKARRRGKYGDQSQGLLSASP
jgi:hypothetical protein